MFIFYKQKRQKDKKKTALRVNFVTDACTLNLIKNLGHHDNGVLRHFQQYFCYMVVVSFIGGGNRGTERKPPTCLKSLTNLKVYVNTMT
jgi:hypothetical protein